MLHDPALLDALERWNGGPWRGAVYRHMLGERSAELANQDGARWNPPGTAALYTSLDRRTALAEGDHVIAVQPVAPRGRRSIYRLEVSLESVLDLRDRERRKAVALPDPVLEADDWGRCQEVGGAAAWLNHDGLLVPSVRDHDGSNLVIFTANRSVDDRIEVRGREPV